MPRVNGSSPGAPSRAAGSKPASASGPYTTSTGMPDSVRRSSMPISLPSGGRAEAGGREGKEGAGGGVKKVGEGPPGPGRQPGGVGEPVGAAGGGVGPPAG